MPDDFSTADMINPLLEALQKALNGRANQVTDNTPVDLDLRAAGMATLEAIDTLCATSGLNAVWNGLNAQDPAPTNKMMVVQRAIGFLDGCRRDLRTQYACGEDCVPRTAAQIRRLAVTEELWGAENMNYVRNNLGG